MCVCVCVCVCAFINTYIIVSYVFMISWSKKLLMPHAITELIYAYINMYQCVNVYVDFIMPCAIF